jgi:hypothetical protein
VLQIGVTAPRSSHRNSGRSRSIIAAGCGVFMLAVLAACGSDSTTSPQPAVVGDYSLQSVDGKAPPDTVVNTVAEVVVFNDGTLSLRSDKSYKLLFHSSKTTSSGTVSDSSGSTGTYSVSGNTVVIRNASTGDSVIATASLPTLTFTDAGQVFIFSK